MNTDTTAGMATEMMIKMGFFHNRRHHRGWVARLMRHRIERKLGLNDRQRAQLAELQEKMRSMHRDIHLVSDDAHRELQGLLQAEQLDRDAARRLFSVPRLAMEESLPELIGVFADFLDALDGEQRQRLVTMWQGHRRHHHLLG